MDRVRGDGVGGMVALGVRWDESKRKPRTFAVVALSVLLGMLTAGGTAPAAAQRTVETVRAMVSIVVTRAPGTGTTADEQVRGLGGLVDRQLPIVNGFSATVPARAVETLQGSAAVRSATPNARGHALGTFDPATDPGSMHTVTAITGVQEWWKKGLTGKGVTVALIDTGVAKVNGLRTTGKVVYGPDLSFESQASNLRYQDAYGHGTHMAGIIAGRDDAAYAPYTNSANFVGVAPDAKILSVRIGDSSGATDVSQMIAAIDWVVQHRNDNGMNVRVLNLSFGTDTTQSYVFDPLAQAAEVAWRNGIVVVAAVGNAATTDKRINMPAADPYVIAVGALDGKGTSSVSDDVPAAFTSVGDGIRNPDLLAPGKSIASLKVPGSDAALNHATYGSAGTRFFRGSGTSQAAAVVSGAAALLLQQRPTLNPDQVKALLTNGTRLANVDARVQGNGALTMAKLLTLATPVVQQTHRQAAGSGTLEAARGTSHLTNNGVKLSGEKDIFGRPFNSAYHAHYAASGYAWSGGTWGGSSASFGGSVWAGSSWSGTTWSAVSWTTASWSGTSWRNTAWSSNTWSGSAWSGGAWRASTWSGTSWRGETWTNTMWQ